MRSLGVDNLTIRPVGFPVIGELSSKLSGDDLVREGAAETFVIRCARSCSYGHYSGVTREQTFKSSGRCVYLVLIYFRLVRERTRTPFVGP